LQVEKLLQACCTSPIANSRLIHRQKTTLVFGVADSS
jgi:hypothetical protein